MPIRRVRTVLTGLAGGDGLMTAYFGEDLEVDVQDVLDVWNAFLNAQKAVIAAGINMYTEPAVDTLDEATGDLLRSASGTGFQVGGTDSNTKLPPATQGLIRLETGAVVGGERLRGRWYVPGVTSVSGSAAPTSAYRSAIATNVATLVSAAAGAQSNLVVWSRKNGAVRPVTSGTVWEKWAVLRSRRD